MAENDEEREEAVKKLKKEMKELKLGIRQQRRREAEEQELEVEAGEDALDTLLPFSFTGLCVSLCACNGVLQD